MSRDPLPLVSAELERWESDGLIRPGWPAEPIDEYLAALLRDARRQLNEARGKR